MVRHTIKNFQRLLQDCYSVCDHFGALYTKGSTLTLTLFSSYYVKQRSRYLTHFQGGILDEIFDS